MDSRYIIREYSPEDYSQVMNLWIETGLARLERADSEETINRTIVRGGKIFLLVDTETGGIIGTSWISNDGRRLHLQYFAISVDYQGKGLAHLLLKETLLYAKKLNMQIKLEVHHTNIRAVNLYKKWGFKYLGDYDIYILRDLSQIPDH